MDETGQRVPFRVSAGGCVHGDGIYHSREVFTRECIILQLEQSQPRIGGRGVRHGLTLTWCALCLREHGAMTGSGECELVLGT